MPKPITRTNAKRYLNGWLVHIPALVSTAVILWISMEKWFWFPEDGPWDGISADVIGNVLQFAAKIHELLVVASLSAIAISMFRRRLVGRGVRLGFLTGGYRVGDINYLLSSPFRHQGLDGTVPWEIFLVTYLVFATVMSTVVGPASAVLLVPTLGWFPLKHDQAFSNLEMPVLYDASFDAVRPEIFADTEPWNVTGSCKRIDGFYYAGCPSGGYSEIWNWVQTFGSTNLNNNLTFNYPSTDLRRHLVFTQPETHTSEANDKPTLLTTPSHFFMTVMGLFQKYIDGNPVGDVSSGARYELKAKIDGSNDNTSADRSIYQPFVQSKCRVYNKNKILNTSEDMLHPTEYLNCFGDTECERLKHSPPIVNNAWWRGEEKTNIQIAHTYFTAEDPSSVVFTSGQVPHPYGLREKDLIYTCSLTASWVASNFSIDPKVSDVLMSSLNKKERMNEVFESPILNDGYIIRFNKDWFQYLVPEFNITFEDDGTRTNNFTSALLKLVELFSIYPDRSFTPESSINDRNTTQAELFLSKVFGVYLTDGISRTGSQSTTYLKISETADRLDLIELEAQYSRSNGSLSISDVNTTHSLVEYDGEEILYNMSLPQVYSEMFHGMVQFDFDVQRYGYGTGRSRKTVTFARAMMYIYLANASTVGFAHAVELTGRGRRFRVLSVVPWSDLQDLIVLALKTTPPSDANLADAGAGVTSPELWKKSVRARADEYHNVQLVLNEETLTERLDVTGKEKYY
ncbi:uncharacterized protein ColSpa_06539 [Colletotrichum spaethianum]|uniref:Uncharacterized protein n=1 Tax=Colletotrichum spaethianum TaxID=700344 RepID=A0AA37P2F0_9PEZI|nr:uncharacterized protein ColSpa_06539 [Colletotrichum spaethianum]GKT46358.1 hypothetical protein ColSpa_06539 [Colletotrichum spaethianum]